MDDIIISRGHLFIALPPISDWPIISAVVIKVDNNIIIKPRSQIDLKC